MVRGKRLCCNIDNRCSIIREFRRLKQQNKRLLLLSMLDPMTELYNVRYLHDALKKEMEKTRRTAMPTSLIMMDLDRFKSINDSFGHIMGDMVLKEVSRILKRSVRASDVVCRYGGEEFAVLLPQTAISDAVKIADRIRNLVAKEAGPLLKLPLSVTISAGVDQFAGYETLSSDGFIDRADQMLLKAKQQGRNKVVASRDITAFEGISAEEKKALFMF